MATDHNFKVKNGLDVLGGKASIAASTSTSSSNALKLHVGGINNTSSSAIAQFGGFIRASEYYILHETTGSTNSLFIDYVGNDLDVRAGEGSYTGFIRANGYKVGTTTVIDSSRNLSNIGSIGSGTITSTGNIVGVGINSTSNYTELGSTSASNLVFKRTNASYIQADGSGGYFIFITNGRSTSYANRALALTTDNNAEFGGAINTVGNVTVGGNLTVNGTTTTLNTATLNVEDKNIVLNYASGDTSSTADGAGITIQDAVNSSTDATMSWDASDDRFDFSHMINVQGGGIRALGADNTNTAYSGVFKNLAGDNVLLVRNDKRVLIPGGYLYVNNSEGIYSTGAIRARGGITNDGGNTLSIDSGSSNINFNNKNFTNVGTITSTGASSFGSATFSSGLVAGSYASLGYQAGLGTNSVDLKRDGTSYINQLGTGTIAFRFGSSNTTGLTLSSTNATFNGTITTSGGMIVTDTSSTGRGIYRNNTGYDLRVGGGTDSSDGAYISVSGETRGGSNSAYNGRIEYYSGGTGFANQAAILGDHVWYAKHAGGSANLMMLDSATGDLNLKLGDFEINGTTVIDSSRNLENIARIRANDGSPTAPTFSFSSDTNTGMYKNSDDTLGFTTGGARRGYFASSGIHSDTNVYTGTSSSFRNYGGTWSATTGLTGNGFNFINSVDGTAMTLSSTGDMTVTNHVAINNFTLSADVALGVRGHGTGDSKYIFSAQDSGGSTKFYVRDDGVVAVSGNQYLYAASSGTSFYSQGHAVFRGNVSNDSGDLTLADHVNITASGALKIAGTQVISSSRALTNITSINATGAIETSSQLASYQGNVSNSFANTSIRLGYSGSASYQQAIKSRHNSGTGAGNAIDFFLWNSGTDAVGDIGTLRVASFETSKGLDIVDGGLQIGATNVIGSNRALQNIISADIDGFVLENSAHRSGLLSIPELSSQTGYTGIEIKRGNGEHWQLMASDSLFGLYEDTTGHWALQTTKDAGTRLYYDGGNKLETITNGVEINGRLIAAATNIDNAFNFQFTDSAANSTQTGMRIDYNASDNTTLTADRTHTALEIDYDVSATGGDTDNEYRAYGINVDIRGAGDTDLRRGVYSYVETQHASGTVSENVAVYGYAVADETGSGRTTNNYGGLFIAFENGTGTGGTANHYGVYGRAHANAPADKNINNMYGGYFEAEYDTTGATTSISNVYALYGLIDNDSTDTNVTNSYLFYGNYTGTINATNPYGIYIADNVENVFAGSVRADEGFKVGTTSIISSSRQVRNVTLLGSTTGARFQSNNWVYDDDNDGRLYFGLNGPTYYKSTSGHRFRVNGDTTRLTIDADGRVNLISGGDYNAPGGSALAVSGTVLLTDDRRLLATEGTNSAPSISFATDTNTGIYRSGTDEVSITNAGTQRFVFGYDSNGARLKLKGIGSNAVGDFVITSTNNASNGLGYTNYVLGVNIEDSTTNGMPEQRSTWGGVSGAAAIALGADDTSSSASSGPITFLSSPQGSSAGTALTVRGFFKDDGDLRLNHDLQVLGTVTATTASGSSFKGPVYITEQNSSGEGGEITLNGSNGNTSHTLDTVNGSFRIFDTSGTFISGNSGYGLNAISGYRVNGTQVITGSRVLQNVTANANIITSGTISGDRIPNLSGDKITSVTTLTDSAWHDVVCIDANAGLKKDTAVEIHGSGYLRASYLNMSHSATNRTADDVFFSSNDSYIRKNNKASFRTSLDVYSKAESVALFTDTGDIDLGAGSVLTRSNHHTGHMEGSYNNIGANGSKSNPIFTIGYNYNPTESALSNMYGIGYAKGSQASFLSSTLSGNWGMYVASGGIARIFLDAGGGVVRTTSGYNVGSTNVIDSSRNLVNIASITASGNMSITGELKSTNAGTNAIKTRFISGAASGSTSDGNLYIQHAKTNNILCFNGTSGNPQFLVYGNDGGTQRSGTLQVGTDGSFNITASDTYLLLNAGSYVQSNKPHNFTQGILFDGTSVINDSRHLQNVTVTAGEAEYGQSLNGNFGQWQAHNAYNAGFNTDVDYWGWNYINSNTNAPHTASAQWYRNRVSLGNAYGHGVQSGDYWLEMAYPRYGSGSTPGHMYIRTCESGTIGSWYEVGAHLRGNLNVGTNTSADINLGSTSTNARLIIKKADNNVPDHIQIFCGGTQTGEIGSQDTTWLRINQSVAKNIYTPRYIRADSGFFVDGGTMGIDGSGRLRAFAGSNSSVGIGFVNDPNTGLFSNGADNIGFATNGTNRVNLSTAKLALLAGLGLDLETSSGNVRGLIGAFETTPHLRIATSNNENIGFYDGGTSGTCNVEISGGGALTVRSDVTAFGNPSDIRLKENIEIIPDAIEKVQKLEGITFNYKKDGSRSTGLIAQQLQEVLPEVVYEAKDLDTQETHYAVRYGNVVGLLVEAIKEQQTQLTAQQEQINQLTNLVNTLMEK